MGNWISVTLTVREEDKDRVRAILGSDAEPYPETPEGFVTFEFESNLGTLKDEYHAALVKQGIPYDFSWPSDYACTEGYEYSRYNKNGEHEVIQLYHGDENPSMKELLERIDDPIHVREYILEHLNNTTVLSWANQLEYAKLYRTKQLISANTAAP